MNHYFYICSGFLAIVLLYLCIEKVRLSKAAKAIGRRFHVNGTRGKSSVTSYIAAGLRGSNLRTFAKITGIIPTIIHPDGTEEEIRRKGPARVHEQFAMLKKAHKENCECIVLECMSLHPENQRVESLALHPSVYVITNIGEDHFEEMGKTVEERVASICGAIPKNGTVVTIKDDNFSLISEWVKKKNAKLIEAKNFIGDGKLPDGIFAQNINLALTAIETSGLEITAAKTAILDYVAKQKLLLTNIHNGEKEFFFLNGFAVNDPPSADSFISAWLNKLNDDMDVYIILNTRSDRPERTKLFCSWLAKKTDTAGVLLTGNHRKAALRMFHSKSLQLFPCSSAGEVIAKMDSIVFSSDKKCLFIGIGNIADTGFEIINELDNRNNK
jgi:poly-gamma-glutamate synthase PgsB/CapB